jgi:hypothetical protein
MLPMAIVFAYLTPERVLPMTSVVATAVGLLLLIARGVLRRTTRWGRPLR